MQLHLQTQQILLDVQVILDNEAGQLEVSGLQQQPQCGRSLVLLWTSDETVTSS